MGRYRDLLRQYLSERGDPDIHVHAVKFADWLDAAQQVAETDNARRLEAMRLLEMAWWDGDVHACRFCWPNCTQASTAEYFEMRKLHADGCPYAALGIAV